MLNDSENKLAILSLCKIFSCQVNLSLQTLPPEYRLIVATTTTTTTGYMNLIYTNQCEGQEIPCDFKNITKKK